MCFLPGYSSQTRFGTRIEVLFTSTAMLMDKLGFSGNYRSKGLKELSANLTPSVREFPKGFKAQVLSSFCF